MSENPDLATIVRSTIELGHSLGFKVVAEGVEDSQGLALLRELGCDCAQGYYLSPPLAADQFISWLEGDLPARRIAENPAGASQEEQADPSRSGVLGR
jgi:EAL domain-containing protein (putative c-di-GMP-specific phosphodiesterase class I)